MTRGAGGPSVSQAGLAPPSVLMVTGAYYPEISGGGLQCRALAGALRRQVNCVVLTTTATWDRQGWELVDDVPVYRFHVNPRRPWTKLFAMVRLAIVLPSLMRRHQVVHFHGFTQKMLLLTLVAKVAGRKTVQKITSVGSDDPLSLRSRRCGWLLARVFGWADAFVSVSPAMSECFVRAQLPVERLAFIPNGVDTSRFQPADPMTRALARASLQLSDSPWVVTFVGFWSREKAPDVLFEAWLKAVRETGVDGVLMFLGTTDHRHEEVDAAFVEALKQRIRIEGCEARVRIVDQTHDVPLYLHASNVFVLPSRREGLPNALLEAMAAGLVCVAADIPGVTGWLLRDGVNGFLVPPGDVDALARVLKNIFVGQVSSTDIGARARETIVERFSIRSSAEAHLGIYERLAGRC